MKNYKGGPNKQFKPGTKKIPTYLQNRTVPSSLTFDEGKINELFMAAQEGSIDKLKSIRGISYNVRDSDGQTLIHAVLNNDIVCDTEDKKYELVKFLINKGVSPSASDKYNITPLHIACQKQCCAIVNMLLQNGANPNAEDSSGMTPMHYATMGKETNCKVVKRIGDIIPGPTIEGSRENTTRLRQLTVIIINLLQFKTYKQYFKHVDNTLENLNKIYPEKFLEIQRGLANKIQTINVALSQKEMDERKHDILNTEFNNVVNSIIKKELNKSMQSINLTLKEKGWTPMDDIKSPNSQVTSKYKLVSEYDNPIQTLPKLLATHVTNFERAIPSLEGLGKAIGPSVQNEMYERINRVIALNKVAQKVPDGFSFLTDYEIKEALYPDAFQVFMDFQDLNRHKKYQNRTPEFLYGDFDATTHSIPMKEIPQYTIFRATKAVQEKLKNARGNEALEKAQLYDESNINTNILLIYSFNHYFTNENSTALNMKMLRDYALQNGVTLNIINANLTANNNDDQYIKKVYITSPLVFAHKCIQNNLDIVKANLNALREHLKVKYHFELYHRILTLAYTSLINIVMYVRFVFEQRMSIDESIGSLKTKFQTLFSNAINQNLPYAYIHETIVTELTELEHVISDFYKSMDRTYSIVSNIIPSLNILVDHINELSGVIFMSKFALYTQSSDFRKKNTEKMDGLFIFNFPSLVTLPSTRIVFMDLFRDAQNIKDVRNTAKNLFKTQTNDYQKFYNDLIYTRVASFLKPNDDENVIGTQTIDFKNMISTRWISSINTPHIYNFKSYIQLKENAAINPIGAILGTHFYNIKVGIIMDVMRLIYDISNEKYKKNNVTNELKTLFNNFQQTQEDEKLLYFMAIAGDIVDGLFTEHTRHSLKKSIKRIIFDTTHVNSASSYLLPTQDKGFDLNLNALFDEIVSRYYVLPQPQPQPISQLRYTIPLADKEKSVGQQYPVYNSDYTINRSLANTKCYEIDPNIIRILRHYRGNINSQDNTGSTPIIYALDTLHHEMVKECISMGSDVKKVKTRAGVTPVEHLVHLANQNYGNINRSQSFVSLIEKFAGPLYREIERDVLNNPKFKNNMIKYLDIALHQIIVMYNHQLFLIMNQYMHGWTNQEMNKLLIFIKKYESRVDIQELDKIPLLHISNETKKYGDYASTLTAKIEQLEHEKKELQKTIKMNEDQNKNILESSWYINQQNSTNPRLQELKKRLTVLENKTKKDQNKLKIYEQKLKNLKKTQKSLSDTSVQLINNFDIYTKTDVVKYYKHQDYMLYNQLWQEYVKDDNKLCHYTNIHLASSIAHHEAIKNKDPMVDLLPAYQKVFTKCVHDLDELPDEYNRTNYMMTHIVDIFAHVTKNIICANLYYAVVKTITRYFISLEPTNITLGKKKQNINVSEEIIKKVNNVLDGKELLELIINEMPLRVVKILLQVFEDEFDNDANVKNIDEFFDRIIRIINQKDEIGPNSTIVNALQDHLFPYYKFILTQTIPKMRAMIDNYNRYILNEHRIIECEHVVFS